MAQIIEMPKLSDTMTTGTLVKWLKNEGDAVKTGDMLAEIETDKATMELESFFDGTLLKQFAKAGDQIAIGAGLCAIGKPGETVEAPAPKAAPAKAATPAKAPAPVQAPPPVAAPSPAPAAKLPAPSAPSPAPAAFPPAPAPVSITTTATGPSSGRVRISPLARKLAAEKGIDFSNLRGTGPGGRIVRADILAAPAAVAAPAAGTQAPFTGGSQAAKGPIQEDKTYGVSNMRAVIARRLVESKTQIPHFYLDIEVDAAPLLALRAQLNTGLEKQGVKLSVNDFILKASAEALRKVPMVNCSWGDNSITQHSAAHVSFAVAIDDGLITPVIRDTHLKSVFQISLEVKHLAGLAKSKKLKPDQFTGGTFCVSNLGMMGIEKFNAIINPPNAAILAVGATVKKPVVVNDEIVVGQRMMLSLSCDHRVVDGSVGAAYLGALKQLLEAPALLLV